jgi:hypothetical protein
LKYLVRNEKVKLNYVQGLGAWTFHVVVPNSKDLKGGWGYIKVSGTIDDYKIDSKNLAPRKGNDMMMSINGEIRKAIRKKGGDTVTLTLWLVSKFN